MPASVPAEPAPGSSLYYALLRTDADARIRFLARLTLIETIATSLHDVTDATVTSHKVHWWHEELDRLRAGVPRHPAARPLADDAARDALATACLDILGVAADERLDPADDVATLEQRIARDFQTRLAMLAHALDPACADALESRGRWHPFALALGRMDRLRHLPRLIHRGYPVFAFDEYRAADVRPEDLAARVRVASVNDVDRAADRPQAARDVTAGGDAGPAGDVDAFLATQVDRTATAFESALEPAFDRKARHGRASNGADDLGSAGIPLLTLAALRRQQCRSWQRHRPDLLRERRELTPIAKFLIAWRCRRRLGRNWE